MPTVCLMIAVAVTARFQRCVLTRLLNSWVSPLIVSWPKVLFMIENSQHLPCASRVAI
ncbi:hypothetical protein D3C72_2398680 [compost metagenome]